MNSEIPRNNMFLTKCENVSTSQVGKLKIVDVLTKIKVCYSMFSMLKLLDFLGMAKKHLT